MGSNLTVRCFCSSSEFLPFYATAGAAGADLLADVADPVTLPPGERRLISTGLRMEIPEGYEAQIRPRSGLAVKFGITLLNTPGTIDSDYRGEIKVIMINLGNTDFTVKRGDRIAQIIISPVQRADFTIDFTLGETERGEGGFGSTGI